MKVSNYVKSCTIAALICLVLFILTVADMRSRSTDVSTSPVSDLNVFDCEVAFASIDTMTEVSNKIDTTPVALYSGIAETEEKKALEAQEALKAYREQLAKENLVSVATVDSYVVPQEDYSTAESQSTPTEEVTYEYTGGVLTASAGVNYGPSGKETYYNLPMDGVVSIMRGCGFSEEEYPYWVREDGVKMLGPYVMVAANLDIRPRGTIVECSLGTALVCDTGGFAAIDPTQLDIAVTW